MTDNEIENWIDGQIKRYKIELSKTGFAYTEQEVKNSYNSIVTTLPFLQSVGRLPQKYRDFNIDSIIS